MKTRIAMPTEAEIATRKRLRLLANQLQTIAATVTGSETADAVPDKLPARIVTELKALNAERGDLMALRQTPHKYHSKPYDWLWMLHRFQNHYA